MAVDASSTAASTMRGLFRTAIESFIDFLYPPVCLVCNGLISDRMGIACPACLKELAFLDGHSSHLQEARDRLRADFEIDDLVTLLEFQKHGSLQRLIHCLKYEKMEHVGEWFGRQIGERCAQRGFGSLLIVPVPLHRSRERDRGFNQAGAIARGISQSGVGILCPRILLRARNTPTQTHLHIEERKANVADAFTLDPRSKPILKDRDVLLVDDVITTGATIGACATALKDGGSRKVAAASIALAVKER